MKTLFIVRLTLVAMLLLAASACQDTGVGSNSSRAEHSQNGNMNHNAASTTADDHAGVKHDMSSMAPMNSAPGAADQPYDLQFIDSMIHHHEGAVVSSAATLNVTKRTELKGFLQKVIDDQEKEIELMKKWRGEWYPGKPSALNMEMPGMKMSSHAVAEEFTDLEYIDMMIPHHEGAVLMAKEALQKAEHDEVKKLATAIIDAQESEIKKMKEWKAAWSK